MKRRTKIVKIADYSFCLEFYYGIIECLIDKYMVDSFDYNAKLSTSIEDIVKERIALENQEIKDKYVEFFLINRKIAECVPEFNAFLLHSVCVDIDGVGVVFSALSGTGKSTHLANWWNYLNGTDEMPEKLKNLLKDKEEEKAKDETLPDLTIVNGDKPIVRFFDEDFCKKHGLEIPDGIEFGIPYAYGTPWCGKENLGCNMRTPLKHICFIERSDKNYVTKIDKNEAVNRIMKQVYMPKDPAALMKTLSLVDRLINSCELWVIHCNMEPESAKVAYEAIFK